MVGIVIVSHSLLLAEGVAELARQMVQNQVPLALAAGIDDSENPIGTDVLKVAAAIESVYSPEGVLVLMDLGSAVLSAEAALELLPFEQQANVYLCPAPLVEGTVAGAVQAALGGTIRQVFDEARGALAPKLEQLEPPAGDTVKTGPPFEPETLEVRVTVRNRLGLHARPAARLVQTAGRYEAEIRIRAGGKWASARSINQVTTLGVRQGDEIILSASGREAGVALAALQALAEANFGDREKPEVESDSPAPVTGEVPGQLAGIPASPGIAVGPAFFYRPELPMVETSPAADPKVEWARLQAGLDAVLHDLEVLQTQSARQLGADEAAIFEAHRLIVQDPALLELVRQRIFEAGLNVAAAWQQGVEAVAAEYRGLEDPYLQGRAADVLDVGRRVLRQFLAVESPRLDLAQPAIIIAPDLTPSEVARLEPAKVLGICTELGGATSHSAILARALGIPAVAGLGGQIGQVPAGQTIGVDGAAGRVWLRPNPAELAELAARRGTWQAAQRQARQQGRQPAVTGDGRTILVMANIAGPRDAAAAVASGADGVGVFRTEFLFMDRAEPPAEAEQLHVYRETAQALDGRPLIIRCLDVGGDKPLPYLAVGREANPFLGWRGLRFCLDQPDLFKSQLRAILQAAAEYNIKLLLPMVAIVAELRAARRLLAEAQAELDAEGRPFAGAMEVGVMIEVPAAVAMADQLAAEADFFSIGSNDLAQYVMAADRGNPRVNYLADALHPAVLRLVSQAGRAAAAAGIPVGLCGELAGDPLAAPLLVGLGMDELSMNPAAIPAVKTAIRQFTLAQARQVAGHALGLESAGAVRAYLQQQSLVQPGPPP